METVTYNPALAQMGAYASLADGAERFQALAYIAAALLFILALAGLSKQKSARSVPSRFDPRK